MRWIDVNHGFVADNIGSAYYITKDGGNTWKKIQVRDQFSRNRNLNRMQITGNGNIVMTGSNTTDHSAVIFDNRDDTTASYVSILSGILTPSNNAAILDLFATSNKLFATITNGKLIVSSDNGYNWTDISNQLPQDVIDTAVPGGGFLRWELLSLWFVNDNTGWICGGNDLFLKTVDGGLNWEVQYTGLPRVRTTSDNRNRSIMVIDQDTTRVGWAVGENGNAWKFTETISRNDSTDNNDSTNSIYKINDKLIVKVYPNPVFDALILAVDDNAKYSAVLYDMNACAKAEQEIDALHKVIDMDHLTKGVYILVITDSNGRKFTETIIKE